MSLELRSHASRPASDAEARDPLAMAPAWAVAVSAAPAWAAAPLAMAPAWAVAVSTAPA